jgi:arabinofuranosyltransferase
MAARLAVRWWPVTAGVVFLSLVVARAWMSDDAFLTIRTLDNFVNGYGLRWNVAERVQAFTHPLWALVLLGPYAVTREPYFTTLATAVVVTAASVYLIGFRFASDAVAGALAIATLATSVFFLDYSTSGLENPLAHVLLVCLVWEYFREARSLTRMAVAAGLLALVRMDLAVLVLPALAVAAWRSPGRATVRAAIAGALPLAAWTTFSLIYYGFPFPNTAYAKLNTAVPTAELVGQGSLYLLDALVRDPVALLTIVGAVGAGILSRRRSVAWPWAAGIALYAVYTVQIGGDYMAGRFLVASFLVAVLLFWAPAPGISDVARRRTLSLLLLAGVVCQAASLVWPVESRLAPLKRHFAADPKFARDPPNIFRFISDQRAYYLEETGLAAVLQAGGRVPHRWAQMGRELKQADTDIWLNWGAVGMIGYYGGPRVHIVDPPSLGDALLARLPAGATWYPGHFDRALPPGYMESVRVQGNLIEDPGVHEYYENLREIISGPVWRWSRFRTMAAMNLGRFEPLLDRYEASISAR